MRFLYKIHSGYDGFAPKRIPQRLLPGNLLRLGWAKYIDVVDRYAEVWVYFHGQHAFENGVYVKGIVDRIDTDEEAVYLRVRDYSVADPLTDASSGAEIAALVAKRYQQVFVIPEHWAVAGRCTVASLADTCKGRECESCKTWHSLPLIPASDLGRPARLGSQVRSFAAAYWVIPSICKYHQSLGTGQRHTSEMFYRYKSGEGNLAYPLALGLYHALRDRGTVDFDAIVPIPLSPEKVAAAELHRAKQLAVELGRLLNCPVREALQLTRPISKRRMRQAGYTAVQFQARYATALTVPGAVRLPKRILLLDDVCTEGSTLACAASRLLAQRPDCEVMAGSAGQMVVKAVVANEAGLSRKA